MNEAPKKLAELTPPPVAAPKPPIDTYSYTLGFTKGYKEGDSMIVGWAFGICGVLAIVMAFMALWGQVSRLSDVLERLQTGVLEKLNQEEDQASGNKKTASILLPLILTACIAGCAGKQNAHEPTPLVPMPPLENVAATPPKPVPAASAASEGTAEEEGQTLTVAMPADSASGPRRGEPQELASLLEMKADAANVTAVNLMRPAAIREAAQFVTFQTAMAWRYRQLVAATEKHSAAMDSAFNFGPLLMTQGEALILPPVLTRAGASLRIESGEAATAAQTSYELLSPARYVSTVPNWREFLMADAFPEPEKPNPAVMPKNDTERAIWRAAVREAWAQGLTEADQLYADNVSRMARTYRGVMLYHLLTAQHLLSKINTASADLGMKTTDNGNKLHIGQKVYRITAPSAFTPQASSAPAGQKRK